MRNLRVGRIPRRLLKKKDGVGRKSCTCFATHQRSGFGAMAQALLGPLEKPACSVLSCSNFRVAPIKNVAAPRIEPSAAVLEFKGGELAKGGLPIFFQKVWHWKDSTIVPSYIAKTSPRFSTFVANRLDIVHQNTTSSR